MANRPPGTPIQNISRRMDEIRYTYGPANPDIPPILDDMERNLQQIATGRNEEREFYRKLVVGVRCCWQRCGRSRCGCRCVCLHEA